MNEIAVKDGAHFHIKTTKDEGHFTSKQVEILKNSICRGVSDEEFEIFLMACKKTQLDPFLKQIYAVKRTSKKPDGTWGEVMTIQTGIDGYRLIAERTGCYAPGPEPTYSYDDKGRLISSTAYIKKMTRDGTWHTVSASAYLEEYMQRKKDGQPMGLWATMTRTMLAKCAESQALRKAFPAEMSGVYTKEEMSQAEVIDVEPMPKTKITEAKMTEQQAAEIIELLKQCDDAYTMRVFQHIQSVYRTDRLSQLPAEIYPRMKDAAAKAAQENKMKMSESLSKKEEDLGEDIDEGYDTEVEEAI